MNSLWSTTSRSEAISLFKPLSQNPPQLATTVKILLCSFCGTRQVLGGFRKFSGRRHENKNVKSKTLKNSGNLGIESSVGPIIFGQNVQTWASTPVAARLLLQSNWLSPTCSRSSMNEFNKNTILETETPDVFIGFWVKRPFFIPWFEIIQLKTAFGSSQVANGASSVHKATEKRLKLRKNKSGMARVTKKIGEFSYILLLVGRPNIHKVEFISVISPDRFAAASNYFSMVKCCKPHWTQDPMDSWKHI